MQTSKKGIAVLWLIVSLAVIICIGVVYYSNSHKEQDKKKVEREVLLKKIADAREKARVESLKLKQMQDTFLGTNPQNAFANNLFPIFDDAISNNADLVFNTPASSPDLKIKAKTKALELKIEEDRKKISDLLELWRERQKDALIKVLDPQIIVDMKNEIKITENFIDELKKTTDALTPDNSGLSPSQIEDYQNAVNAAQDEVNQIASDLNTTPHPTPAQDASIGPTPNPNPVSTPTPDVSPQDIQNQQQVVDNTQSNVTDLEQQLAALPTPTPPPSSGGNPNNPIVPTPTPTAPDVGGSIDKPYVPPIINPKGVPKLIQGED